MFKFLGNLLGRGARTPDVPATAPLPPDALNPAGNGCGRVADAAAAPPPAAPVPAPSSVWWTGVSGEPVAMIQVVFAADRTQPGTLVALDAAGRLVSGPWAAVGKADEAIAADYGNRDCDPLLRFGDTPTGDYQVLDVLPARVDETGIGLFGPNAVLRLRPLSGDAAAADANGRTALLIHGGAGGAAPTDGSIRVPDEAMASLLKVLPANPAAAKPRITVRVQQAADDSRPQAWRTRPASLATADARHWRASGGYPSSIRRSATWQSPYYSDDGFWFAYYQQMYLFDLLNQAPYDQRCTPGDYYPYVDPGCEPAPAADPDGAAAANALSALGYDVGQQPQDPQPAVQTGAAPAPSGQPDAGVTAPDTAPVGQDIGHDRSVGPLEALQQASDTSSWIPDGGAYGR